MSTHETCTENCGSTDCGARIVVRDATPLEDLVAEYEKRPERLSLLKRMRAFWREAFFKDGHDGGM